jgi:hypothetical protein
MNNFQNAPSSQAEGGDIDSTGFWLALAPRCPRSPGRAAGVSGSIIGDNEVAGARVDGDTCGVNPVEGERSARPSERRGRAGKGDDMVSDPGESKFAGAAEGAEET